MQLKPCKITDCLGGKRAHNGLCNKHYLHMRRHGKIIDTGYDLRPAIIEGDIAKIPLGINAKDGYAIIDAEYAYLAKDNWNKTHYGYVRRSSDHKLLHRVITKVTDDKVVDHRDGNRTDNRLSNIRICTQGENSYNQGLGSTNTSGYKGVSQRKGTNKWEAYIKVNGKRHHLGLFASKLEGAIAYNNKALELHGEYARLNNV